jgi:enoyl-CoA hydratase
MTDCVICEIDEGIAKITLNRPEAANSLNQEIRRRFRILIEKIAANGAVRAVIVTGQGSKAFAAGTDVRELRDLTPLGSVTLSHEIMALQDELADLPQPSIAAIQGACLGGGFELALACDIRIAAENSRFGLPEIRLGIFYELGIVTRVVATEKLDDEVRGLARHLSGLSSVALAQIKRVLRIAEAADPDTARRAEAQACSVCFGTFDQREGMTAFLEKRPPVFSGSRS